MEGVKEIQLDYIFGVYNQEKVKVSCRIQTNNKNYYNQPYMKELIAFSPKNQINICYDFRCEEYEDMRSKKEIDYFRLEVEHFDEETIPIDIFYNYLEMVLLAITGDRQLFNKIYQKLFNEIKIDIQTPNQTNDILYLLDIEHANYVQDLKLDPFREDEVQTHFNFKKVEVQKQFSYQMERISK